MATVLTIGVFTIAVWLVLLRIASGRTFEPSLCPSASILTQMRPLLQRHLTSGCEVFMTGADGSYSGKERWVDYLETLAKSNCQLTYILLMQPNEETQSALARLVASHPKVDVRVVTKPAENTEDAEILSKMVTFHFLLSQHPKGRMMWIEHFHAPGSSEAFDCEFVPPSAAASDSRFDELRAIFDRVRDRYTTSLTSGTPVPA